MNLIEKVKGFFSERSKSGPAIPANSNNQMIFDYTVRGSGSNALTKFEDFYDAIPEIFSLARSITAIQKTVGYQAWSIKNKNDDEIELNKLNPELQRIIKKPGVNHTFDELNELLVLDLLVAGNVYSYEVLHENKLYVRRLKPYAVEFDGKEFDLVYRYTPTTGTSTTLENRFLSHLKFEPHPKEDYRGWGVIEKNLASFRLALNKIAFRENFIKNGCNPSAIFTLDSDASGLAEGTQAQKVIDSKFVGPLNNKKPILIPAKLKYQQLSFMDTDDKLDSGVNTTHKEIMACFGLPRFLTETGAIEAGQKYNNFEKQLEHYMLYTIAPILEKITVIYNRLVQRFYPELTFSYSVPTEIYTPQILQGFVDVGLMSLNDARAILDLARVDDPALDVHYYKGRKVGEVQAVPIPQPEEKDDKDADEEDEEKKPVPNALKRKSDWRGKHKQGWHSMPQAEVWKKEELKKEHNQVQIRRDFERLGNATIDKKTKEASKTLTQYLTDCYGKILRGMVDNQKYFGEKGKSIEDQADVIIGKLWSEANQNKELTEDFVRMYNSVGAAAYDNTGQTLTVNLTYKGTADPATARAINLMRKNAPLVNANTKETLQEILKSSLKEGLNTTETAKEIWRAFTDEKFEITPEFAKIFRADGSQADFDKVMSGASKSAKLTNRALLIARNEIAVAHTEMMKNALTESGVVKGVQVIGCSQEGDINSNTDCVPIENIDEIELKHIQCSGVVVPCAYDWS